MGLVDRLSRLVVPMPSTARGKNGARAYAVGDVHGRLDLLERMLAMIEGDVASRAKKRTFAVFLGDLIDRGPDSAGVIERLRTWRPDGIRPVFLTGNHEEVMLRVLAGEEGILPHWLKFGGSECLASYGLNPSGLRQVNERTALERVRAGVPPSHQNFLESFGDTFRFGDYLLVHAGIRPGVAIEDQHVKDLRWIREPFLSDGKEHGFVVVHGHTVCDSVEERENRIGIDTGAYVSGDLTALSIEDEERWYLSTARGPDPRTRILREKAF